MKKRFWRKYLRALRHLYRLRRQVGAFEACKAKELTILRSAHSRELLRKDELIEALHNKIEIVRREAWDRTYEALKLTSVGFATRDVDDQIRTLTDQPFVERKQADSKQKGLYYTLDENERSVYDQQKADHWDLGRSQGYDEATIARTWIDAEETVVSNITGWEEMIKTS